MVYYQLVPMVHEFQSSFALLLSSSFGFRNEGFLLPHHLRHTLLCSFQVQFLVVFDGTRGYKVYYQLVPTVDITRGSIS
jgi:hypothetical protein